MTPLKKKTWLEKRFEDPASLACVNLGGMGLGAVFAFGAYPVPFQVAGCMAMLLIVLLNLHIISRGSLRTIKDIKVEDET